LKELLIENIINENIYLISDTHFFHDKIGIYCDRPDNWQKFTFENWNDIISDKDIVLHLGDLALGNKFEMTNILKELKGQKFLIKGNHDRYSGKWIEKFGFHLIKGNIEVRIDEKLWLFSHRAIYNNSNEPFINIHGHQHNKVPFITKWNDRIYVNCSVEVIGYKPIKLSYILERLEKLDVGIEI